MSYANCKLRVGILVISFLRPQYLSQCLEAVSRVKMPIKVYLVNQGDRSEQMKKIVSYWSSKLNLVYKENKGVEGISNMKRWGMESMKVDGLEYCVILDDDVLLIKDGLEKLVEIADAHKDYHTIAGFLIEGGTLKLMVGGFIRKEKDFITYPRDKYSEGFHQVEWAGGGFTIHRLEPLVLHDPAYIIGLEDYDYSFELKKFGLKVGVTGDAGAYHKILVSQNGRFTKYENTSYNNFRMERKRLQPSFDRFKEKWGIDVR